MTDKKSGIFLDEAKSASMLALTTKIVAAYLSKHAMPVSELPLLIDRVFPSLASVETSSVATLEEALTLAVPVKKSVFADFIVCLEDGKKLKMLKRHLMTSYGLTPDAYRERWKLPSNYPMVAPDYANRRSVLAKAIGLGRMPASQGAVAAEPRQPEPGPQEQHVTPIPKTRRRKVAKAAKAHEA